MWAFVGVDFGPGDWTGDFCRVIGDALHVVGIEMHRRRTETLVDDTIDADKIRRARSIAGQGVESAKQSTHICQF